MALLPRTERLSSTRTLAAGILWTGLGRFLPAIVALLCTPFLLHHLGIDRWGLFTLALSVAGSFGILDFGIGAALTRALAEQIDTPAEHDAAPLIVAAIAVLSVIGITGSAVGFVFVPALIDHGLNVPAGLRGQAIVAFRLLAAAGPLIIVNAALWGVLCAYQRFRLATLANIPINVIYYVGPIAALLAHDGLVSVIAGLVFARLVQTVTYGWLALRVVPELGRRPRFRPSLLRPLLRIGLWTSLSNTLWPVMLYLDRFIVGGLLSLAAVSYYATSLDLVMRLMMVPMSVAPVLYPAIAMSFRSRPERARALLRIASLVTILAVFPCCLVLVGLAGQVLSLWLGAGFAARSQSLLVIVAIGMYFNCVAVMPATFTDAIGRPEIGTVIMLVQAVLFPPVVIMLATRYGIQGAALAWSVRAAMNCIARLVVCGLCESGAARAVPSLLLVTFAGAAGLLACAMLGTLHARLAAMAILAPGIALLACTILLEADEIAQCRRMVRSRLLGTASLADQS